MPPFAAAASERARRWRCYRNFRAHYPARLPVRAGRETGTSWRTLHPMTRKPPSYASGLRGLRRRRRPSRPVSPISRRVGRTRGTKRRRGAGHQRFAGARQDRVVPIPVPRPRGRLSEALGKRPDGQVGLCAGLRQRVGAPHLRQAARQVRRLSQPGVPGGDGRSDRRASAGPHTIGVYPMLPDDTCRFLAADFDKASWRRDANAFLEACRSKGVPAALERSRSGNGGHVWIFFAEPGARRSRAPPRRPSGHRGDGAQSGYRVRVLRPVLPEPGHGAGGRLRQSHRASAAGRSPGGRQQRLSGRRFRAPCRPVGVSLVPAPPLPGRGGRHRRRGGQAGPGCRAAPAAR